MLRQEARHANQVHPYAAFKSDTGGTDADGGFVGNTYPQEKGYHLPITAVSGYVLTLSCTENFN